MGEEGSDSDRMKLVPETLLTNMDLKEWLGLSDESILRQRQREEDPLPHLKFGRKFYYRESEIMAWMKREGQRERARTEKQLRTWRARKTGLKRKRFVSKNNG